MLWTLPSGARTRVTHLPTGAYSVESGIQSPSFRSPTSGPELDLVREYLATYLPPTPRGQRRSIFLEPKLESGYPDVVVVYWHPLVANQWKPERAQLTKGDLRILHFLSIGGPATVEQLKEYFPSRLQASLRRLAEAGVIWGTKNTWRARTLRRTFAIKRLIAIEAKIDEWRRGFRQATQNLWFASESYLLLASAPRDPTIFELAEELGIGVLDKGRAIPDALHPARHHPIPRSYASWLFNEWVWRAELHHHST